MKKGLLILFMSVLTAALGVGAAQATSFDFVGLNGSFGNNTSGGVTGTSIAFLVTATPPGAPFGTQFISGGALSFSSGSLATTVSGSGGSFTNTYNPGGSFSISGTTSGASGNLVTAIFGSTQTLQYNVGPSGASATFTGFFSGVTVNPALSNSFFGQSPVFGGGNLSISSLPIKGPTTPTSINNVPIGSANAVVHTPEPGTLLLFGSGLLGLGLWSQRRKLKR